MDSKKLKFTYNDIIMRLDQLPHQVLGEILHDVAAELEKRKSAVDYTQIDPPESHWKKLLSVVPVNPPTEEQLKEMDEEMDDDGVRPYWDE